MNSLQALYRLQLLETNLDTAKGRVSEIETELQNNSIVAQHRAALEEREAELHRAQGKTRDLELDIAGLGDKITQGEALLYGGKITNPRELKDRQAEVESLKRLQATRQQELDAARALLSETEARHTAAEAELERVSLEQLELDTNRIDERENLNQQMGKWLKERKVMLERIDADQYKIYKKLKTAKNGLAVARLQEEMCSVCQVEQTQLIVHQVRQGKSLVMCNNCGRILVEA